MMTKDEMIAELRALRERREGYALCVANPKPDREHALYDEARLAEVLAALAAPPGSVAEITTCHRLHRCLRAAPSKGGA